MYRNAHIHTHAYVTYIHTGTYIHTHTHIHTGIHTQIHTYMYKQALHLAAKVGGLHILERCIKVNKMKVRATSDYGVTALHMAAAGGHVNVCRSVSSLSLSLSLFLSLAS
jgi:hypothetical protein